MAEPLTDDELDGLYRIQRVAALIPAEIASQTLGNALGVALTEIARLRGEVEDSVIWCLDPDCGHWAVSHYTGAGVKTGCALCFCTLSMMQVTDKWALSKSAKENASSVGEG